MKLVRFAITGALALLAAACLPVTTKTPVGTTAGFKNDPALSGLWIGHLDKDEPSEVSYFHFVPDKEKNTITLVGVTPEHGDSKASWGSYTLTTAVLGGHHYMNAREASDNGKPKAAKDAKTIPLLYTVEDDTLKVFLLDEDQMFALVKAKKVAGKIIGKEGGLFSADVVLTADGGALDAMLAAPDAAKLFTPFLTLTRAK